MRQRARLLTALGLAAALATAGAAAAQTETTGKILLESKAIVFLKGIDWGDAVLEYRGQKYTFTVDGLSVMDLGVTKVAALGEVKNLKALDQFSGVYTKAAGAAANSGVTALRNQNGVEIDITPTRKGVNLSVASGGVDIKLKR